MRTNKGSDQVREMREHIPQIGTVDLKSVFMGQRKKGAKVIHAGEQHKGPSDSKHVEHEELKENSI